MTSIEQTGRNIDEATRLALRKLDVSEDEVDVEILEEGHSGFLGLKRTPARVRVTLKMKPVPPPVEAVRQEEAPKPRQRQRPRPRPKPKPKQEIQQEQEKVQETKPKPEPKPAQKPARRRQSGRPAKERVKVPAEPEKPITENAPIAEQVPAVSEEAVKQAAENGREILQHILDGIEVGGTAEVKSAVDGQIVLNVKEGDAGILIGKHGQTIDALQYLISVIINRKSTGKIRVAVDVEGYRDRREEALKRQALYLAERVKGSGEEAVLEPLQAHERRIVHTALADDPDVYTYSEGQEPDRHVVISPKK